jgi:hypothetical protein
MTLTLWNTYIIIAYLAYIVYLLNQIKNKK